MGISNSGGGSSRGRKVVIAAAAAAADVVIVVLVVSSPSPHPLTNSSESLRGPGETERLEGVTATDGGDVSAFPAKADERMSSFLFP